jgi:hemerythrin-like domain-containing protein
MSAIEVLMDEHRVIERTLTTLTAYARAIANGADLPRADLAKLVDFLREYADAYHHGKEEDILFRAMVDNGMPKESGPLAVMLSEHAEGRRLTGSLADLAVGEASWDPEERRRLLFAATGYARLLRQHIQKEDCVLYPMATRMLSDDVWQRIESEFSAFTAAKQRADHADHLKGITRQLADRYAAEDESS